eukprot:3687139-Prymnesium_polylepis.1
MCAHTHSRTRTRTRTRTRLSLSGGYGGSLVHGYDGNNRVRHSISKNSPGLGEHILSSQATRGTAVVSRGGRVIVPTTHTTHRGARRP